jgi:hypothetical protein
MGRSEVKKQFLWVAVWMVAPGRLLGSCKVPLWLKPIDYTPIGVVLGTYSAPPFWKVKRLGLPAFSSATDAGPAEGQPGVYEKNPHPKKTGEDRFSLFYPK